MGVHEMMNSLRKLIALPFDIESGDDASDASRAKTELIARVLLSKSS